MTKLEEKLIELGYSKTTIEDRYLKDIDSETWSCIWLKENKEEIDESYVINNLVYTKQQDIDNLQEIFNEFQKDLEILKGVLND